MSDDFYEDDEDLSEVLSAFREGEPGVTQGPRALSDAAQAMVDRAVARLDAPSRTSTITMVFDSSGDLAQPWETTSSTHETTTGELVTA